MQKIFDPVLASNVRDLAAHCGYDEVECTNEYTLSFRGKGARINVYCSMTVGTCITHPNKGSTQLYWRNCSINELRQIFFESSRTYRTVGVL